VFPFNRLCLKQKQKGVQVPFVATHNNGGDDETITML
jgi:hypothetical protein